MSVLRLIFFSLIALSFGSAWAANKVVLNVQDGEEIRYLDPQKATGVGSAHIGINLFSGLYEYDHKTASPEKDLAISFTRNENSSVWTFKLRKDVYWVRLIKGKVEKVRPVTAHDFVYSYRRMLTPELASEYAYFLYILKDGKAFNEGKIKDATKIGVKALDDYTLELTTEGSVPSLISYLPHHSFHVVPREPIEKYQDKWIHHDHIWTNGPFAFKEWKLKDEIQMVKNPFHPDAKTVQADEVNFKFIGTYSTDAIRAFKAGKIDIDLMPPPTSEISPLKKSGNLRVARQLGTYFARVNISRPGLKDPRVRKALALTVPRSKIIKYIMKTGQTPAYSLVPDAFKGYTPVNFTHTQKYADRVKEARKLLADAGYPGGKGLPPITYLYNTAETHQKIAVVLAKEWKKVLGINVRPLNQEWKVYLNTQTSLDYDLARAGWIADMEDPMNFVEMFITGGGNNNTTFSNKEYDRLINEARKEGNLAKRNQMMEKVEAILMEVLPVIPLFNYTSVNVVQNYIEGFYPNKIDQHPLKYVKIDLKKRTKLFSRR